MATKAELRQSYIDAGWEVEPVAKWRNAGSVGNKTKYDVHVFSPENKKGDAQVVVTDDGGQSESAVAEGFWKDTPSTFDADVREYASGLEGGQVFAVAITQVFAADEVAEARAYMSDGSTKQYVVKRRSGSFSFKELV